MTKFVIIAILAVFTVVNARGITGDKSNQKNYEIVSLEKESRLLLEVPLIGALIFKSLKVVWFLLSSLCSIIDYKLAAVALAVNFGYYLFSNCFSVVVGSVLVFGFCKLTGFCSLGNAIDKADHTLSYAAEQLHLGALKYGSL